jgi:uncharacterized protein
MSSSLPPGDNLPEKFYEGIEQFNRQEFFEAHETLELVWRERQEPDRIFIQGIIQITVACHHHKQGNLKGALSLFKRGLAKLEPFQPSYAGLNIEKLTTAILALQADQRTGYPMLR